MKNLSFNPFSADVEYTPHATWRWLHL